jgi:hypothetical protein
MVGHSKRMFTFVRMLGRLTDFKLVFAGVSLLLDCRQPCQAAIIFFLRFKMLSIN